MKLISKSCGITVSLLATFALLGSNSRAAVITWTEAAVTNSLPTQWLQTNNWSTGTVPGSGDIATFGAAGTNALVTIQMATAAGYQNVGEVAMSSADTVSRQIYNNSTTTSGTLIVHGVNGILTENSSASTTLFFDESAPTKPMLFGLATSGQIEVDNASAETSMYSVITNYGGTAGYSKTGDGILFVHALNVYTGPTTNSAGTIEADATGNFGIGTNTLYFAGGSFLFANDRTASAPYANPVVMSADTLIESTTGTAGSTRTVIFNGNWSGSGNTLTIGNLINNGSLNTFLVNLEGGFNFGENILIGSANDTIGAYAVLELANTATNGTQTFTGIISSATPSPGSGYIYRTGTSALPGGTSIFTGNNTYSGGTYISYGSILANNTTGSALGSGQVTVTNQGVLGGNGSVIAVTHVGVEAPGGKIAPGSLATNIGNLNISDLTFGPSSVYDWDIVNVTNQAGVNQDLITCSTQWTDQGNSSAPITVKVDSAGLVPAGWNPANAYDWVIIQSTQANGFNASDWSIDTSAFGGSVVGGFGLYVDITGDLHLTYTPGYNLVINVPSGSESQETVGYPNISGPTNVIKVGNGELVMDDSGNTYAGLTTILGGTLSLAVDALSGSGALGDNSSTTVLGNTTGSTNAALNIDAAGVTDSHNIEVQAGGSGTLTVETTLTSGTAIYSGNIALATNATLAAAAGGTASFAGNISGTGGLNLTGGGTLVLTGLGSYSGTTTAGNVDLDLDSPALGTNTFTINSGVTLDNISGNSVTLDSCPQNWVTGFTFTGSANLNLGAGPVTLTTNVTLALDGSILTVGGPISGTGSLNVTGTGTLALLSSTNSSYTGATTNAAGVIEINANATFGNGAGPLVMSGGNLLVVSSRAGEPIINPVLMTTNTRVYGNGTLTGTTEYRYVAFFGPFDVTPGATNYIDNLGVSDNYFAMRLEATNGSANFDNINWPIVVGDPTFDTSGAFEQLDLANDNTTPTQFVNSVISGPGLVDRGQMPINSLNTGGTTVFNQQNTFSGGMLFDSGAIGFGTSSISSGGTVVSGPVGAGTFTIGNNTTESAYTLFAYGSPQLVENYVVLNGCTNIVVVGTNNLTFSGPMNMGGVNKNWDIEGNGIMTISGQITNSTTGVGGLSKSGPGTLVFGGDNLYVGETIVTAGTLLVDNTVGSGTSTNFVDVEGGELGGMGAIGGNVTFETGAGGHLYKTAGSADSPLSVAGNLSANGNTITVDLGGTTTLGAGTYTLLTYSGTLSGSFNTTPTIANGSLAGGNAATISLATPNQVNLVVAPGSTVPPSFPPGSLGVLPGGNISLTVTGAVGTAYRLWATTNLALTPVTNTWTLISSNTVTASPFTNYDMTATNFPHRFYLFTTP